MFSLTAGVLASLAASMLTVFVPVDAFWSVSSPLHCRFCTFGRSARNVSMSFFSYLPDALDLMSRALSAGHAFSEALHMVVDRNARADRD